MSSFLVTSYYVLIKLTDLTGSSLAGSVILDCGCGFGRIGHLLRSMVDKGGSRAYLIGCDISKKYLAEIKRYNPYDELVLCDIRNLPFRLEMVNHIIASEVIEHLTKRNGSRLLKSFREQCTGNVILTTPYFPYPQEEIRDNPFEKHRSFWKDSELEDAGFETEVEGYEQFLRLAIRKLHLTKLVSRIEKKIWKYLFPSLVAFKKAEPNKSLKTSHSRKHSTR
jgi:SAM-dependent methyltransferase